MRRIGLAVVLAFSLLLAPLVAEAQPGKTFRVGFLTAYSRNADAPLFDSFRQGNAGTRLREAAVGFAGLDRPGCRQCTYWHSYN